MIAKETLIVAAQKAQQIFQEIYDKIPELDDISFTYEQVTGKIHSSGFSNDGTEYEFPIEYLSLSLEEINKELDKKAEEDKLAEIEYKKKQKEKEIFECRRNIKASVNNQAYYKDMYKKLTGEEFA